MRLDKFLCEMQIGTRSEVKDIIKKSQITVNGEIIKKADLKIDETKDRICYQGKELIFKAFHYYMLHKPAGVITATQDKNDKTVMELLPAIAGKKLSPVGRLDKDTEGLLLITDDGELAHNLLSPKKHIDKTYYVKCKGKLKDESVSVLETGVDIGDDKPTLPAKVTVLEKNDEDYILKLTITEGRFHQVKRMIQAIDGEVTYLKRLSMGALQLDPELPLGAFRELTQEEVEMLKNR